MKKVVYLLSLYCDNDNEVLDFEKWLINVLYKINVKTFKKNIILEYGKLYEKNNISTFD